MSENKKRIVIVGGGIAGLSAGIYGKLAGYDVDIYEKNFHRIVRGQFEQFRLCPFQILP